MNKYYQLVEAEDVSELYIFGDIVDDAWFENEVEGASLCKEIQNIKSKQINVYINSYGGSVSSGLAIYNQLKQHSAKVTTICQGFGCSIASVIFMAGDERLVSNASLLMVHMPWTVCSGNAKELRKQAEDLDKIAQASITAYMEKINISEEELVELLDNETWLTAQECIDMGFATGIVDEQEEEAVSQSVRQSLIDMIMEKCKDDKDKKKKKCQEDDTEQKVLRCPECDYEGEMEQDEDGYYICPECDYKFKEDDDDKDDDMDDVDEKSKDDKDKDDNKDDDKDDKKEDEKKQGTELKVMSSFLNLFK